MNSILIKLPAGWYIVYAEDESPALGASMHFSTEAEATAYMNAWLAKHQKPMKVIEVVMTEDKARAAGLRPVQGDEFTPGDSGTEAGDQRSHAVESRSEAAPADEAIRKFLRQADIEVLDTESAHQSLARAMRNRDKAADIYGETEYQRGLQDGREDALRKIEDRCIWQDCNCNHEHYFTWESLAAAIRGGSNSRSEESK